jgi:hypothetical protein
MNIRNVIFVLLFLAAFALFPKAFAQQTPTSMMLLPQGDGALTISVPFYLDNASNLGSGSVPADGSASFVGVKNMGNSAVTLTLTYTDTEGVDHTPIPNTYVLAANSMVSWRPFADDPAEGNSSGRLVPNTDDGPAWGSIKIDATGPVTGRLITMDGIQDSTSMMLLPEGDGAFTISVPFYLDNASNFLNGTVTNGSASFIGVKNMDNTPIILTLTYTDTEGVDHTPVDNTYLLAANSMVSWRPSADDPAEGNTSGRLVPNTGDGPAWGSVKITATGRITGRLITIDGIQDSTSMMLLPEGSGSDEISVPFYLDNAANFSNGTVTNGSASFIGVKNMNNADVTLTLTYTDTAGIDHTPVDNTYVLAANSMVSWRPFADDPAEGNSSGRLVPNASNGPAWGSVKIDATDSITGRLITIDGVQNSTSMMLLPEGGGESTVSVPFYLDNADNLTNGTIAGTGSASFVGIKNMSNSTITLVLTYTDTDGMDHTPINNSYILAANSMVSWRPFADDPIEGDASGRLVPNSDGGPAWGSLRIDSDGPLTGRLITLDGRGAPQSNFGGSWRGPLTSAVLGTGVASVDIVQNGSTITGRWAANYSNPSSDNGGTFTGTVSGNTAQLSVTPFDPSDCSFDAQIMMANGAISGSFVTTSCNINDSGTVSGTKVSPANIRDVAGNWSGTIASNGAGNGTLSVSMVQSGLVITGNWSTDFAGSIFDATGFLAGVIDGNSGEFILVADNPAGCPIAATGTFSGNGPVTLSGSYTSFDCGGSDSGTFSISR